MNKNELLSFMQTGDAILDDMQNQIDNSRENLEKEYYKVKEEAEQFFIEYFPDEIISLIGTYFKGEIKLTTSYHTKYFDRHYDLKFEKLRSCNKFVVTCDWPETEDSEFWHSHNIIFENKELILQYNYESLDNYKNNDVLAARINEIRRILSQSKENMPRLYQAIADRRQQEIDNKRKQLETVLNATNDKPQKKYKITIEIEEEE